MVAAPVGFTLTHKPWAGEVVQEIAEMPRPSVCGCTLRTSKPQGICRSIILDALSNSIEFATGGEVMKFLVLWHFDVGRLSPDVVRAMAEPMSDP
jgi:hypothetical protein